MTAIHVPSADKRRQLNFLKCDIGILSSDLLRAVTSTGPLLSESDEEDPNYSESDGDTPRKKLKIDNEKPKDVLVALPSVSIAKKRAVGEGTRKRPIPVEDDDWKTKYFALLEKYNEVKATCNSLISYVYNNEIKSPSFTIPEVEEKTKEKSGSSVKDKKRKSKFDAKTISEDEWKLALDGALAHCLGGTHYKSTIYPIEEVIDIIIRTDVKWKVEQEAEYRKLLKESMTYVSAEMVNKRGKWSNNMRKAFWNYSGIRKLSAKSSDEERNNFTKACKDLREANMRVHSDNSRTYNWHRGTSGHPFDSDWLVQSLGEVFGGSGFLIENAREKPVTMTLDQLAFSCYTVECIIDASEDITLKKEVHHNTRKVMEWRTQILEIFQKEIREKMNRNQWRLERVIVTQPLP